MNYNEVQILVVASLDIFQEAFAENSISKGFSCSKMVFNWFKEFYFHRQRIYDISEIFDE